MLPTVPTVSKIMAPNINPSPSFVGENNTKMLNEAIASKQVPTRTNARRTIPDMAKDQQSIVDFFTIDFPKRISQANWYLMFMNTS